MLEDSHRIHLIPKVRFAGLVLMELGRWVIRIWSRWTTSDKLSAQCWDSPAACSAGKKSGGFESRLGFNDFPTAFRDRLLNLSESPFSQLRIIKVFCFLKFFNAVRIWVGPESYWASLSPDFSCLSWRVDSCQTNSGILNDDTGAAKHPIHHCQKLCSFISLEIIKKKAKFETNLNFKISTLPWLQHTTNQKSLSRDTAT